MATSMGAIRARRIRCATRQHLADVARSTRVQRVQREAEEMPGMNAVPHDAAVPRPGGPSAKSFHRVGSSAHHRNTSEEGLMVEPIPLRPFRLDPAVLEEWDAQDAADLLRAESLELEAQDYRSMVEGRALLRWLFGPQGVAS